MDVRDQPQAVAGDAAVGDDRLQFVSGSHRGGSGMRSRSVAWVKAAVAPATVTAETVMPLPAAAEVRSRELTDRFDDAKGDGGLSRDPVGAVFERQPEDVVNRVDAGCRGYVSARLSAAASDGAMMRIIDTIDRTRTVITAP